MTTDLERQCEEIRNSDNRRALADLRQRLPQLEPQYFELLGTVTTVAGHVDTLLAYIDELKSANQHLREGMENLAGKVVDLDAQLRRPSDAKEIERISRKTYAEALADDWTLLLHALAESQRDNARLIEQQAEAHCAIAAAGVETTQRIRELEAEIARLQSPPEERRDIVERRAGKLKCYLPVGEQMQADIDTLLQDCAKHRNAHVINMARADAAERLAAELKRDLQAQIAQRLESGEKFAQCLLRAEAAEKRVREVQALLSNLRLHVCSYGNSKPSDVIWERVAAALASPLPTASDPKPVAWVPIHPRTGPLWANTISSLDADRPSYPLMPLYAVPAAARDEHPDKRRLDWIDSECADLRCQVHQYPDDSDTYYQVMTFHMDKPKERIVGEGKDSREAIDSAIAALAQPQPMKSCPCGMPPGVICKKPTCLMLAQPQAEPLKHIAKDNGDCVTWCKACAAGHQDPAGVGK